MAAKRRKPRLDDGDDAAGIEGEVEAGGDDRAERRGKIARLGGVDDMRRTKLLSDIAPRRDRFDKNDRRATLDHRAHHRREPDRAAAEDRDTRSRRTRSEEHTSELQSLMRNSYA